jgi:beta-N-acetylhexosaminidase
VNVTRARLDSVELVPFRAAVAAGVGAIMTFHGAMPALDPSNDPGTLSRKVLTGLLRDEMKFEGLVISDAMDMRGVLDKYDATEAAIRAVEAGADVLIQPLDVTETIDAVVAGVRAGRYDEARLDRSVRRILRAKARAGLHRERTVDLDRARAVVGDSAHLTIAREAAERSITLVRDSLRQVPLTGLGRDARLLSITFARRGDLVAGQAFDAELRARFPKLRAEWVNADEPGARFQALVAAADSADAVIVSSYVAHAWNVTTVAAPRAFADFMETLVARGRKPILVAMGNPYLLQQVPSAPAYLVGWGGFPVSQQAAARALAGAAPISGVLPITIPGLAPAGTGIERPATVGATR